MLLDLDTLLAPIPGDEPAGGDLRHQPVYDEIREARREDDPSLPQGVWETPLKKADWPQVRALATDVLARRSKDLQVANWLTEALTRDHGLAGAAEGLALEAALCHRYWDDLYPKIEDGDLEFRLGVFHWLNDRLALVLQETPVTRVESGNGRELTWQDWQRAQRMDVMAQRDRREYQRAEAAGEVTSVKFNAGVGLTPTGFYRQLAADLAAARAAADSLIEVLEESCGADAPSLGRLLEQLTRLDAFARSVLNERGESMEPTPAEPPSPTDTASAGTAAPNPLDSAPLGLSAAGPIRSREEAYRRLAEIAEYLSKVEPHSPTPYLIRRAVAWGNMTLAELLDELTMGERDIGVVYQLLGIHDRPGRG